MSNEVAAQDAGTLEVFPPARAQRPAAVAALYEHAETYNTAWKMAGQLVRTSLIPKRFAGKQADAAAAILYGAELGLKPWQAVQRVVPIHGMPTLESRTMVGLLKAAGYKVRTTEQSEESVTVVGRDQDGDEYVSTWTIARAIRAGYVPTPKPGVQNPNPTNDDDWVSVEKFWDGKRKVSVLGNMKYITDPQTMLKAKAQAEVCREMAPDVLMGIGYSREDLESEQFDNEPTPERAPSNVVTEDEIFAEEVPLSTDQPAGNNPPAAADVVDDMPTKAYADEHVAPGNAPYVEAAATAATAFPETPAGAVTEDQGDGAPDTLAPAAPPAQDPVQRAEKLAAQSVAMAEIVMNAEANQAAADREAKATSQKIAAKRSTAPAADPERPKSRMRKALEKRLFSLLNDAGLSGDAERDGRLAVYGAILDRADISSTDDLDDTAVSKVADQLYAWSEQSVLDDEVAAVLSAAVAAETTAPAPADASTSEGEPTE